MKSIYKLDKKIISNLSKDIAEDVANKIYYTFLMARHIPEIEAIKRGEIKALEGRELKKFMNDKIKSLSE